MNWILCLSSCRAARYVCWRCLNLRCSKIQTLFQHALDTVLHEYIHQISPDLVNVGRYLFLQHPALWGSWVLEYGMFHCVYMWAGITTPHLSPQQDGSLSPVNGQCLCRCKWLMSSLYGMYGNYLGNYLQGVYTYVYRIWARTWCNESSWDPLRNMCR